MKNVAWIYVPLMDNRITHLGKIRPETVLFVFEKEKWQQEKGVLLNDSVLPLQYLG